jgi:pyruvate formate lyase activating enzyme
MIVGGLQKNSLIDYPGKVSCVCFLTGCNFDCPYCHNPDLVLKNMMSLRTLNEDGLYSFLEARKGLLDGVVVSGGEPTLERELAPLCRKIKAMGYAVKLDTNGSRPEVIKTLIEKGLVDYVAMDVKTEPVRYSHFIKRGYDPASLLQSIQIIMGSGIDYEFRTTCVRPLVEPQTIENIGRIIEGAGLYALQSFHGRKLLHPEFFEGIRAGYDQDEMVQLKSIAEPWVKQCILR